MTGGLYLINATIIFFVISLELSYNHLKKKNYYDFRDAVTNLSSYFSAGLINIFLQLPFLILYNYLFSKYRLLTISGSVINWLLCIIAIDFIYYWWHRFSHQLNLLWVLHNVHHQSSEYNLSVAVRKGWFTKLSLAFFYIPLILIGFPVKMILVGAIILATYQFYLHVRFVGKLGWLEYLFCTPSHHRVHHGTDELYLNKNYAGILIIWDKLFGTFSEEQQEPRYGTLPSFQSYSLIDANCQYFFELLQKSKNCQSIFDSFKLWFMPPDWQPVLKNPPAKITKVTPSVSPINKLLSLVLLLLTILFSVLLAEVNQSVNYYLFFLLTLVTLISFISVCRYS